MTQPPVFILILAYIWSLFWKGIALWKSAHNKQRYWFIAMLATNTIGLLELVYLFKFASKRLTIREIKSWIVTEK